LCRSLYGCKKPQFTKTAKNALNPGMLDPSGETAPIPHGVYIEDDIYLDLTNCHHFEQMTAAGIKAVFIILEELDIPSGRTPSHGKSSTSYLSPR
jgi:hypothetical protein